MSETPIYRAAIIEAKRRTKRHGPERRTLALMDEQTTPKGETDLAAPTPLTEENHHVA